MKECDNCGAFVSESFWRVFCDNDGALYSCPECAPMTDVHGVPREDRDAGMCGWAGTGKGGGEL